MSSLNVKICDIVSDGLYTMSYKPGSNPCPTNSGFTTIGTGLTASTITLTGLTFNTQYWVKMTDESSNRYIIRNISTNHSKTFPCYDTMCFNVVADCDESTPCDNTKWITWTSSTGGTFNIDDGKVISLTTTSSNPTTLLPLFQTNRLLCPDKNPVGNTQSINLAGTYTYTFSQPVLNPLLSIHSLGRTNPGPITVTMSADTSFSVYCSGVTDPDYAIVYNIPNKTLSGDEGYGIIQFDGLISQITLNLNANENFTQFSWGLPCPNQILITPTPTPTPTRTPTPTPTPPCCSQWTYYFSGSTSGVNIIYQNCENVTSVTNVFGFSEMVPQVFGCVYPGTTPYFDDTQWGGILTNTNQCC